MAVKNKTKVAKSSLTKRSFQKFCKNPLAIIGLLGLIVIITLVCCAPLLTDYDPNKIDLTMRNLPMSVTNIGSRPTVGGHRVTVEPWLLDFAGDLYGKKLRLELHAFLREERKFGSLEELKAAILENEQQTRKLLGQFVN